MTSINVASFYTDIEQMTDADVEALIQGLDNETTLALINQARAEIIEDPNKEMSQMQVRAGLLLVRKFRAARSDSRVATKRAAPAKPPAPSLETFFGGIK